MKTLMVTILYLIFCNFCLVFALDNLGLCNFALCNLFSSPGRGAISVATASEGGFLRIFSLFVLVCAHRSLQREWAAKSV